MTCSRFSRAEDDLAGIADRLPGHIASLADAQLELARAIIPSGVAAADGLLPFDIERMVGELPADLKGGRLAVTTLLNAVTTPWRAQRVGSRGRVPLGPPARRHPQRGFKRAQDGDRIDPRPRSPLVATAARRQGRGRRAPGSRRSRGYRSVDRTLGACRRYASELAVSEVTLRAYTELQQYLDTGTRSLVEGLRGGETSDRPLRQSQVEAAVRFCAKLFGPQYGALLGKAAEVATNSDRKAASKA